MTNVKNVSAMFKREGKDVVLTEELLAELIDKVRIKIPRKSGEVDSFEVYAEYFGTIPSTKKKYDDPLKHTSAKRGRPSKITVVSKALPESSLAVNDRGMFMLKVFHPKKTRIMTLGSYDCLLLNKVWFDKKGIETEVMTVC